MKLSSITLPNSVTSIGSLAFGNCKSLSTVTLPTSLISIGKDAFHKCKGLTSINIPNSVTSIGEGAFALCSGLTSIRIPVSVTIIGKQAFVYCDGLTSISVPNTITSIGDAAFGYSPYYKGRIESMPQWLINKGLKEWERCGLSEESVNAYKTGKKLYTPTIIKADGGYASALEMKNGSTKYYKVSKGGRYGLTDSEGKEIVPCEMEALESAGTGYLKYKINGFWGVMDYTGKIIIGTERGYTSIGDYISFTKRFPYTMAGYKGECDAITGRQLSKIRVETPAPAVTPTTPQGDRPEKKDTIIVKHDLIPVNVWVQCNICGGSGRCQTCGGSGIYTGPAGNRTICTFGCGGSGKCSFCAGQGGHYEVQYK